MAQRTQAEAYTTRNGWRVTFSPNVHMYAHALKASKAGMELYVPCEDTPEGFVGIWPYQLQLEAALAQDLLLALREWAPQANLRYRLYSDPDDYGAPRPAQRARHALLIVLFIVLILAAMSIPAQ